MNIDTEKARVYAAARTKRGANGCRIWTGPIGKNGYGVANLPGGVRTTAHRLIWTLECGPIPDGLHLDHECHNRDESCPGGPTCPHRPCVEPDHLAPIEPGKNSVHGKTVGALNLRKTGCKNGHSFDRISANGWRSCSICASASKERSRRRSGDQPTRAWSPVCANGHTYTEETTRWSRRGYRNCKLCDRENSARTSAQAVKPCKWCGGPKPRGRSRRYCDACTPEIRRRERRYDPSYRAKRAQYQRAYRARQRVASAPAETPEAGAHSQHGWVLLNNDGTLTRVKPDPDPMEASLGASEEF